MKKSCPLLSVALVIIAAPVLLAQDSTGTTSPLSASPSPGAADASGANGQRGEKFREAFAQLGLTDAQKAQIKQIRASTQPGKERREQIMAVLTPEQKQKLVSLFKEYRSGQAGP
jgi:Spy/CpxP family protein refolding chaperone